MKEEGIINGKPGKNGNDINEDIFGRPEVNIKSYVSFNSLSDNLGT